MILPKPEISPSKGKQESTPMIKSNGFTMHLANIPGKSREKARSFTRYEKDRIDLLGL